MIGGWNAWALAPVAALATATALLVYALRGRKVDEHPLCRHCGFDLFAKPEGSTRCPECGADLTRRRATRVGRRQRRPRLIAAALPVLLASSGWLGFQGWQAARATDWNRHKPVWWLVRNAGGGAAAVRDAALNELARRIALGKLNDAQLAPLIDRALAYQADLGRPWTPAWGRVVEKAHDAGRLSPDLWERYAFQTIALSIDVRPTVRRGDAIPFRVAYGPFRVGDAHFTVKWQFDDRVQIGSQSFAMGGLGGSLLEVPEIPLRGRRAAPPRRVYSGELKYADPDDEAWRLAADGPQTFGVTAQVQIWEPWMLPPPRKVVLDFPGRRGSPTTQHTFYVVDRPERPTRPFTVAAPLTLLPAARPSTRLNTDPAYRPAVEAALQMSDLTCGRRSPSLLYLSGTVSCAGSPIDLDYDVFFSAAGWDRERPAGRVRFDRVASEKKDVGLSIPQFEGETVDVILRPSASAATLLRPTEIWAGEVGFKAVPVRRGE